VLKIQHCSIWDSVSYNTHFTSFTVTLLNFLLPIKIAIRNKNFRNCWIVTKITKILCYENLVLYGIIVEYCMHDAWFLKVAQHQIVLLCPQGVKRGDLVNYLVFYVLFLMICTQDLSAVTVMLYQNICLSRPTL